ncbi:MAG: FAD-dependent oxidoreductase [Desulfobacteraceae bacterium]|jgi:2-polyprenyl-6-methoxyphenol hydroxylase-like FAD-dependent oxidoreductase
MMKSSKEVNNGITRREFVKNTALKGAAALAIGAGGIALPDSSGASTQKISGKTITEAVRETRVCRTADVVVVGGGPGGIGAALTAARSGADTVLIERYEHLGGMGTGGLVTIIPNLSDFSGKQQIAGISQEWIERLEKREATDYPKKEHWGTDDPKLVKYYQNRSFFNVREKRVLYSAHIDAEISKCILQEMVEEAGVKTYLHAWGTEPVMDGNQVKGVIFESKSGRQAILAKVVIDSTGDGDLLPYTGADFESSIDKTLRIANLSFSYWIANVDLKKYDEYKSAHQKEIMEQMREIRKAGGHGGFMTSNLKNQESLVWVFPRYPNKSQVDVEELTRVEFLGRKEMLITHDYYKKNIPGFDKSFIVLTNPQLGTRGARRVVGEYVMTEKDMDSNRPLEDTIAVFPDVDRGRKSLKSPVTYMPYRCMIPKKINNLLVACRAFSSNAMANNFFNYIPHCIALGEAAGTAAAQAINSNVDLRKINIKALQASLKKQGVILSG